MQLFYEYITYLTSILNKVFEIIFSNWLTMVIFGFQIIYLIVVAVKLKRNTE